MRRPISIPILQPFGILVSEAYGMDDRGIISTGQNTEDLTFFQQDRPEELDIEQEETPPLGGPLVKEEDCDDDDMVICQTPFSF